MKFWLKLLHEKSGNVQSTKTHKGNYHVHDFVIKFNFPFEFFTWQSFLDNAKESHYLSWENSRCADIVPILFNVNLSSVVVCN
jgi:hypothetical protein